MCGWLSCREDGAVEVAWDALKTEVAVIAPQHSLAWTNRRTFDATNSAIRIACDRRRIES